MADVLIITIWIFAFFHNLHGCPDLCLCTPKGASLFVQCSDLTELPAGVPPHVTSLSLSANKLTLVTQGSFDNNTRLTSLWMQYNNIFTIEPGALAPLVDLQNLDMSHNKIVDFPWADLRNLTSLQLLKLGNNEMIELPQDALVNLHRLRSLHLNNNRFFAIAEGTFDGLGSLAHLRIFLNPFLCDCSLYWLRNWMLNTTASVIEQDLITCAAPEELKGKLVGLIPQSACPGPYITIRPNVNHTILSPGDELMMTCQAEGDPAPTVTWHIHELEELNNDIRVYDNGTILVSVHHSANYSCTAKNQFGESEKSVFVEVKPTDPPTEGTVAFTHHNLTNREQIPVYDAFTDAPVGDFPEHQSQNRSRRCHGTRNTHYMTNDILNGSSDDQHVFNFGVISLGVSETDVTVRLNPLYTRRSKQVDENSDGSDEASEIQNQPQRLYLCSAADQKHFSVQWTRIKAGVNTYKFDDLLPGANYSLCLTDSQDDCKVHVLFTTRRRAPNLLVIISVSIGLLSVATIPLIVAICYHLTYKYRNKTRSLTLKARDQYWTEMNMNLHMRSRTESQKNVYGSQLDGEGSESTDKGKEADSDETVSFQPSHHRENLDTCEVESENSDRLPLGAEAVNITAHCNNTNQQH